jgi:hypothetical protein
VDGGICNWRVLVPPASQNCLDGAESADSSHAQLAARRSVLLDLLESNESQLRRRVLRSKDLLIRSDLFCVLAFCGDGVCHARTSPV